MKLDHLQVADLRTLEPRGISDMPERAALVIKAIPMGDARPVDHRRPIPRGAVSADRGRRCPQFPRLVPRRVLVQQHPYAIVYVTIDTEIVARGRNNLICHLTRYFTYVT